MKLVIGNQKMSMNRDDVVNFVNELKMIEMGNVPVIICPSFPYLNYYEGVVKVGAQNVSFNDNGAYTGEVSGEQLKSLNVSYCIIGHSERREYQKETDQDINKKLKKLLENSITPILCIGEKLTEREEKLTETVIKNELDGDLKDLSTEDVEKIIIAYEPIWAIGTGLTPNNAEINEMMLFIKSYLKEKVNCTPLILYGGSVSDKNIDELNKIDSVDGYLIGGASTKIDAFKYIINSQKEV